MAKNKKRDSVHGAKTRSRGWCTYIHSKHRVDEGVQFEGEKIEKIVDNA